MKTQDETSEQALEHEFVTLFSSGARTDLQFSSFGMKPTISYVHATLQGILCLIVQREVGWEEEFKCRQKTIF